MRGEQEKGGINIQGKQSQVSRRWRLMATMDEGTSIIEEEGMFEFTSPKRHLRDEIKRGGKGGVSASGTYGWVERPRRQIGAH